MIDKEKFIEKNLQEVTPNIYSLTFNTVEVVNNNPIQKEQKLIMIVDQEEENELGTFIETKLNDIVIRTGYYKDVDDLLSDMHFNA